MTCLRRRALFPYLPPYWIEHVQNTMFKGPTEFYYPPTSPIAARRREPRQAAHRTTSRWRAARPRTCRASSRRLLISKTVRRQVLDDARAELAILRPPYPVDSLHNPDAAVAFARAVNDWLIAEWLDKEPRLRASIVVPVQMPELGGAGDRPRRRPSRLRPGAAARAL